MIRKQYSAALTATCVILGVIIGVQVNTVKQQRMTTEHQRLSEATAALNQLQAEHDALLEQNETLEKTLKEYQDGTVGAEMEQLLRFAGLTAVSGPGVAVTMNDSSTRGGGDMNAYLVHAEDLLAVVNELHAAGAEAVSINGQRMVGNSAITCAGSIVMVNGVRVAAPFEIKAVGEPDVLHHVDDQFLVDETELVDPSEGEGKESLRVFVRNAVHSFRCLVLIHAEFSCGSGTLSVGRECRSCLSSRMSCLVSGYA